MSAHLSFLFVPDAKRLEWLIEMTFDELWARVQGLPDTALVQVPTTLSSFTKKKLEKYTPAEIGKIVADAIEEVNRGSVEPLDVLIKKRL